jgi:hypothetical protein
MLTPHCQVSRLANMTRDSTLSIKGRKGFNSGINGVYEQLADKQWVQSVGFENAEDKGRMLWDISGEYKEPEGTWYAVGPADNVGTTAMEARFNAYTREFGVWNGEEEEVDGNVRVEAGDTSSLSQCVRKTIIAALYEEELHPSATKVMPDLVDPLDKAHHNWPHPALAEGTEVPPSQSETPTLWTGESMLVPAQLRMPWDEVVFGYHCSNLRVPADIPGARLVIAPEPDAYAQLRPFIIPDVDSFELACPLY